MAGYRNLIESCAAIDRRSTRYRFDLERDLRWDELGADGALFGPRLLESLGIDREAGAHPLFQWAFGLATCEEFIALEEVILRFAARERALLGPTRSLEMLVEEEEKHILLFRRWADHFRRARPGECARFDRAFAASAQLIGHLDDRTNYPDDASFHYVFWLNTLVFEEYTIYLHECLAADAGIQPAWLAAHAAHRREEEQHLVTDAAHLDALDLDEASRDRWSKMFFVRLSENAGRFFGLEASRRFLDEAAPEVAQRLGTARFDDTPLYQELVSGRAFRRTRQAAPYLRRLTGEGKPSIGARLRGLFQRKQPPELERFVLHPQAPETEVPLPEVEDDALGVVRRAWAEAFGVEPAAIGLDASFASLGGDSPRAVEIHGLLERHYKRTLDPRILLDCRTVREFAAFLEHPPARQPIVSGAAAPVARTASREIAIVGAQGRFPGARDLDELWQLLRHGSSTIGPVPADRWDADAWYDPDLRTPARTVCRVGGFLDDVRAFDPEAFGLDEAAGREMDPQQRLFLELAADLLDASGAPERRVGVFAGAGYNAYAQRFSTDPTRITRLSALGNLENMVAARVSQALGLTGPALTVNAACASSLVAVHLACQSLRAGECELAVAGGVELYLTVTPYLMFSQTGVLSPTGRCRPFSRHADGFVPGEGAGVVLLKSLDRARADGDRILGVIKGSAVNNDGGGLSGLAPSPSGQLEVLERAYADAGLSPADISYIEAHGTGTPIGDPVEVRALSLLHSRHHDGRARFIGSLKGNLGHLFNAAGVASLIKVLLALEHGQLPPTVGCEEPDPRIDFPASGFTPVQRLEPWLTDDEGLRRAGVSAFGVGGTNCHVIVEEAPVDAAQPAPPRALELVCLSAPGDEDLARVATAHAAWLKAHPDAGLASFAAAANARADRFPVRRSLVCTSIADARAQLESVRAGERAAGRPRVCFVVSGPGSQYPGMGRHLYDDEPVFRDALDACAARLDGVLERPLEEYLYDEPQTDAPRMDRIEVTQPLVFSFGYALARWLESSGVRAGAFIGHSAGEYLAACLTGALTLDEALALVVARGQAMAASEPGKMAAVFTDEARVRSLLGAQLGIAAFNEPGQVVLSGAIGPMDRALAAVAADGVVVRELRISCAAHSPLMEPLKPRFGAALAEVQPRAPSLPFYSTVTGRRTTTLDRAYWLEHLSAPVDFVRAVRTAAADGYTTFVEVGGGGSLSHCVQEIVPHARVVPLLRRSVEGSGWQHTLEALGQLHEAGVGLQLSRGRVRASLPAYPYRRRELWIDDDAAAPAPTLDLSGDPSLRDHRVHDRPIAPAALLVDEALAAARARDAGCGGLGDLVIGRPLPGDPERRARVRFTGDRVLLESRAGAGWDEHLAGRVLQAAPEPPSIDLAAIRARAQETVSPDALYRHLEASGLTYGATMRSVDSLQRGGGEVLARLSAPAGSRPGPLPAAIVDGAMQAIAGLTVGWAGADPATFLGFGMGEARTWSPVAAPCLAHVVLRSPLDDQSESFRVDVTLAGEHGRVLARFTDVALKRFHDPARPRLYAVRWQPAPLPSASGAAPGSVLLFGAPSALGAALKRRLEDGGVPVRETSEPPDRRTQKIESVIAIEPGLERLFALVQALGSDPLDLMVVSADPALAGFLRVAAEEHPAWRCRAVELAGDAPSPDRLATRLVAEWRATPDRLLIAYDGAERRAPSLEPLDGAKEVALRTAGVYLITGGMGGIGLELARLFARRAGARLVLTGRRDSADPQVLAELAQLGADAVYVRADAADPAQMKHAFETAQARFGGLHGVVHAAGVLDDELIAARTLERLRRVVSPKVDGARVLLALCGDRPLDFIVLCSSLASLFGGAGQADYAAANAHLDGLARRDPRVLSIDWGPWRDVGMVAAPAYQRRFAAAGLHPLAPAAAARALLVALASGERQVAIAGVDSAHEAGLRASFNRIGRPGAEPELPELPAGERPPVREFLRAELAARLRRAELDPRASFVHLGVDSLLAVEMVRKLERRYGLKLHPTLLFELKTIDEVAGYVESRSTSEPVAAVAPVAIPAGPSHDAYLAGDLPLTLARVADAPVGDDELEIEVHAAGVNFIDLLAARGLHPILGAQRFVPGHEVAGVVRRVGSAVRDRRPGDRVMAIVRSGGYARRVVTPESSAVALPEALSFEDGAALVISGLTAISCLEHHGRLQRGERILIQAAAGATGLACVQLARHLGAEIFGTASALEKLAFLAKLGVQHPIDYKKQDFADAVRELTGGEGVDVIVDSLSGDAITRGLSVLRAGGRFLEIGAAGVVDVPPVDPRRLFLANQSFVACNVGLLDRTPSLLGAHLHRLSTLAAEGVLQPVIAARVPFADAASAHELLRQRKNVGKLVLVLG